MSRGSSFSPAVEFTFVTSVKRKTFNRATTEQSLPEFNRTNRVSISIKFCIKHTSYKLAVAFGNPGTDGNPHAINISRHHHIQAYFTKYWPSPPRANCYVPAGVAQVETEYTYGHYVYTREPGFNPDSDTPEPDRPQHVGPTACVLSSSSIFPSLSSHSFSFPQEKIGLVFQQCYYFIFYFVNCVSLK